MKQQFYRVYLTVLKQNNYIVNINSCQNDRTEKE